MIEFKSFLAEDIENYLQFRTDTGHRHNKLRWFFKTFDRFIIQREAGLEDLTPAFLLEYRNGFDMNPGSINKTFILLRGFFDYLIRMEKISENPAANIPALAENHYIPFVFSPEQVDALLLAVEKQIRKTRACFFLRDLGVYTALRLMARCGLRISEPFRLITKHYRRDEMTLYIEKTKFHKDRLIPVPKKTIPVVDNFISIRDSIIGKQPDDAPLLTVRPGVTASKFVAYKYFHRAVNDIGIKRPKTVVGNTTFGDPTPHSLRHSFAVNTLNDVKQRGRCPQHALPVLAAYLGHTDWSYTMNYLKVIDADQGAALVDFCIKHRGDGFP